MASTPAIKRAAAMQHWHTEFATYTPRRLAHTIYCLSHIPMVLVCLRTGYIASEQDKDILIAHCRDLARHA